jgi:hypothetical protein
MPQVADLLSVETVEPVGGADVQQYVTHVRLQDQAIYKDEVLRQTEEANVIVASSYNAVAKWSLMNSLVLKPTTEITGTLRNGRYINQRAKKGRH